MSKEPTFSLEKFQYSLPEEKIAKHPLPQRDQSKLLVYHQGKISDNAFYQLPDLLPTHSTLFFNNTRVIPARLFFRKNTTGPDAGALIEVFLLQPVAPTPIIAQAMQATGYSRWLCMIGNLKKWKEGVLQQTIDINGTSFTLEARLEDRMNKLVSLTWPDPYTFAEVVEAAGQVPLPPYMNREVTAEDKPRYQTVYSKEKGAVAAPTAGLHFTEPVLKELGYRNFPMHYFTLHVSAGTFQPIKTQNIREHPMHAEQMVIPKKAIEVLLNQDKNVIAVGTTAMRTLESLYWYGVKLLKTEDTLFRIDKDFPYQFSAHHLPSLPAAVEAILQYMHQEKLSQLMGETSIFIFPGYQFKVCKGLITNFHLPGSTLILLVAAFVGEDWRTIYQHALSHDYRFLSYGDSSLLLPKS
jgi:S-adenosylmethionine:tRNA ribosyltransferase-isomerase